MIETLNRLKIQKRTQYFLKSLKTTSKYLTILKIFWKYFEDFDPQNILRKHPRNTQKLRIRSSGLWHPLSGSFACDTLSVGTNSGATGILGGCRVTPLRDMESVRWQTAAEQGWNSAKNRKQGMQRKRKKHVCITLSHPGGVPQNGRLIFIHLQCWEVLPFLTIQRQRYIKSRVLRVQDFYTPLALNCEKGQHLPALEVYKSQSPTKVTFITAFELLWNFLRAQGPLAGFQDHNTRVVETIQRETSRHFPRTSLTSGHRQHRTCSDVRLMTLISVCCSV